jgi:hypothetical protein
MDSFLIAYIGQRMREKGFAHYHFMPFYLETTENQSQYRIEAYNEFLYLTSPELKAGTTISADNNIFQAGDNYSKQYISKVQEFTGLIEVTTISADKQCIEFIRVIPQTH